jgi:hypothetical protein
MIRKTAIMFGLVMMLSMTVAAGAALAQTFPQQSQIIKWETPSVNPCTGEPFYLSGFSRSTFRGFEDQAGGFHVTIQHFVHGEGVGEWGGQYVVNEQYILADNFSPVGEAVIGNVPVTIVRKGEDGSQDDFVGSYVEKYTLVNGKLVVEFVRIDLKCV